MANNNTVTGLSENIEGALCYALGFLTGIAFLVLEKTNSFVRFHAMQSIVACFSYYILTKVLLFIPVLGWITAAIAWPLGLVLWVFLMYKAYQGEKYKLPVLGDIAENLLKKKI